MASASALTAELQSFVHRVEELLIRAREAARTDEEAKAVDEVEEQFRARVVPFANSCKEALFGGGLGEPDLERLGAFVPITTRIQPPLVDATFEEQVIQIPPADEQQAGSTAASEEEVPVQSEDKEPPPTSESAEEIRREDSEKAEDH